MFDLYDNEKVVFKFQGIDDDGIQKSIQKNEIDFVSLDDPFERVSKLIEGYSLFLTNMGVSTVDYYFMLLTILDKNEILDVFYKYAKEENILGLYEELESRNLKEDNEETEKEEIVVKNKNSIPSTILNFDQFEARCITHKDFRRYLYQIYIEDAK